MNKPVANNLESIMGQVATEFFERLALGQSPQIEEYAQRHPEFADVIRNALTALQHVSDSMADGNSTRPAADEKYRKRLGDFLIHRELGRGGMGIVYEAEQLSMGGRHVALKVLPFATMADATRLQRFRNEVQAAASLDHPHIVSIYSVGEERGVHFYAMQLIRGQSMATLIEALRKLKETGPLDESIVNELATAATNNICAPAGSGTDPTEDLRKGGAGPIVSDRSRVEPIGISTIVQEQGILSTKGSRHSKQYAIAVAELGIQAAEALEHAHQRGVIHRDIKPANLMIDGSVQLYVTDFGLAQMEQSTGVTMTGDLIGTLRYMSPEQALGKRVSVDHRTDIYALGVSLYELLTTKPAFDEKSRAGLIKQIAFEEPKKLSQLDGSIPRDLETIIHKAIAKNPDERYLSAQELADDLRAFIESRPIVAKPPTWADIGKKWAFRNQGYVLAGCLFLLMATIGSLAGAILVNRQKNEAVRQRKIAESNLNYARETVDTYLTKVSEDRLLNTPSMQPLRKELLELALTYYKDFVERYPTDPELQSELADALIRVGDIQSEIGSQAEALKSFEQAVAIWEALSERASELNTKLALVEAVRTLMNHHARTGNTESWKALASNSMELLDEIEKVHGQSSDVTLARVKILQATARGTTQGILNNELEALRLMDGLVEDMDSESLQRDLVSSLSAVGGAYFTIAKYAQNDQDTENAYRNSISYLNMAKEALQHLIAETPKLSDRERLAVTSMNLWASQANLAMLLLENESTRDQGIPLWELSRKSEEQAATILEELVHENPLVVDYLAQLGVQCANASLYYSRSAKLARESSDFDEAMKYAVRSSQITQRIASNFPGFGLYKLRKRSAFIGAVAMTAVAADWLSGDRKESLLQTAIMSMLEIPEEDRNPTDCSYLGQCLYHAHRYEQARISFQKCVELRGERGPTVYEDDRWWYIAMLEARSGELDRAKEIYALLATEEKILNTPAFPFVQELRDLIAITEPEEVPNPQQMLLILMEADSTYWRPYFKLAGRLNIEGNIESARTAYAAAAERLQALPQDEMTIANEGFLAQALYESGDYRSAQPVLDRIFGVRQEKSPTISDGPRWWYRAMLLARAGNKQEAREIYDQLVADLTSHAAPNRTYNERFRQELAGLLEITEPPPHSLVEVSTQSP